MRLRWPSWGWRPGFGEVTLAIDDGPSDATPELLALLEGGGHRAVLFTLGCNVAGREAILVDAVRRGFALGNHSFDHPHFSSITIAQARSEIVRTEASIEAIYTEARVERPGKWFRFPYLDTGKTQSGAFQALLGELGFERPFVVGKRLVVFDSARRDWPTSLNTLDWALPDETDFRATMRLAQPDDVIEFHDKLPSIARYAAALVEELAARSLRAVVPGRG